MRSLNLACAVLLVFPALTLAQHDPYGEAAKKSQTLDDATQLQRQLQQALLGNAADVKANVARLRSQRDDLADQTTIVNNVISYRKKDDLARWVEDAKKRWNAESGPRIRIFNPYEMSSYSRYYDEKGNLMVSEVLNSYEYLQQQRQDWEKARKRAEESVDSLERDYAAAAKQYGIVQTARSDLAASLAEARRRLSDFTGGREPSGSGDTGGLAPLPVPKPKVLNLAGRTGKGEWAVGGKVVRFTYVFMAGGRLTYRSATGESLAGSWTQNGNQVTVQVGKSSESGTLSGNKLVLEVDNGGQPSIATVTFDD